VRLLIARCRSPPFWQVAVNVSGVQFRDGGLVSRVSRAIEGAGIESRMIELEFTEGALIEYSTAVSKAVKALKTIGVATALDDFGTGYSSLSYLRHFPIDTLKIDRGIRARHCGECWRQRAAGRRHRRHGEKPRVGHRGREGRNRCAVAIPQEPRRNQVQGFLFCRPLALADLERWRADWLHSHQPDAASVA
jgi:EAL domain